MLILPPQKKKKRKLEIGNFYYCQFYNNNKPRIISHVGSKDGGVYADLTPKLRVERLFLIDSYRGLEPPTTRLTALRSTISNSKYRKLILSVKTQTTRFSFISSVS